MPLLPPDLPDDFGTSCPRDCLIESECIFQHKVSKKVQMIHHQLMGPAIASHPKCPNLKSSFRNVALFQEKPGDE